MQVWRTQKDLNAYLDICAARAARAETRRDREPEYSPRYWAFHDVACRWHNRIESLGPGGNYWKKAA